MQNEKTVVVQTNTNDIRIDNLYRELGRAYYEGAFEDPLPQLLPIFDEITKIKNENKKKKLICPYCQSPITLQTIFCGECGHKVNGQEK